MKIAFLACAETLPGSPKRRPDAFEHDIQFDALHAGIAGRATLTALDWRAPIEELAAFDLAILATVWDYVDAKDEFLARLEELSARGVQVCNPPDVVRWNADKSYLADLDKAGVPSIPTLWVERPTASDLQAGFQQFDSDQIVVKRRVGSGAVGQSIFHRSEPMPENWQMDMPAMIQPFLPHIQTEGEHSFIFIDGALSHALIKKAKSGDYRIQSLYGGYETAVEPEASDRKAAQDVMDRLPFTSIPLYARIDMVRREDGVLALIEAELIEPYLYPEQGPQLGAILADAILKRKK
jgi:glutathione synthase/RimK-type ligase-like ATP-grasp enzyme